METITLINKIILRGACSILFPWDTPPLTLKVVQRRRAFAPLGVPIKTAPATAVSGARGGAGN